jgi:hypothetical protein
MSTPRLSSAFELKLAIGRWLHLAWLLRSRHFRRNLKACGLSPRELMRSMSHSVRYLRQCERRRDPYPVVVVDGFLDGRMMTLVSQSFPGSDDMEDMPVERTRNAMARRNRKLFRLNPESLEGLSVDRAAFWDVFSAFIDLLSPEMMHALPDPAPDMRVESFQSGFKVRKDLWMDRGGFQISPHTDGVQKYATFLLYCSGHPSLEQEGTSVFVPKDNGFRSWSGKQFKFDDFDEVFRAPYRKNLVFGFRKTDNSFHGKYPGETTVEARKTISITVQSKRLFKV